MTQNEKAEIQIAIAKFCGWYDCHYFDGGNVPYGKPDDNWNEDAREFRQFLEHDEPLPDYINDLNVIHEVENLLNKKQWNRYVIYLAKVIAGVEDNMKVSVPTNVLISATAEQRSKALFKLITQKL